jgi:hypothetical protein
MTTLLPDSARVVLGSPALAHLVTLNPDGSPQVTVVWVGVDGDEIVAAHLPEHRKCLLENSGGSWLGVGGLAGEAAGHHDDHGPVDVGFVAGGQPFVVADGSAVAGDP